MLISGARAPLQFGLLRSPLICCVTA